MQAPSLALHRASLPLIVQTTIWPAPGCVGLPSPSQLPAPRRHAVPVSTLSQLLALLLLPFPLFCQSHRSPLLQFHRWAGLRYATAQPSRQRKWFLCLNTWRGASCSQAGWCLASSYVLIGTLHTCRAIISVPTRKLGNYREKQQVLQSCLLCVRSFKMPLKRNEGIMKA